MRTLKKGDKFFASQVDEGEFRFAMSIKEHRDAEDSWVIAFKDGCPYTMQESDIDADVKTITHAVLVPKAGVIFKGAK